MVHCKFCQITINKKESLKIYEDKFTLCLLDTNPISKGHCLIIPKKHFNNILDIDKKYLTNIIITTQTVSKILKKKLKADGFNILHASGKFAQQSVFHFHLHLVPRYKHDKLNTWPKSNYKIKALNKIYREITE